MDKAEQLGKTAVPVTVIRPPRGWIPTNLRELWAYLEPSHSASPMLKPVSGEIITPISAMPASLL